jgi:hypothetical protein
MASCSFLKEDGLSSGYLAHADRKPVVVPSRLHHADGIAATRKLGGDLLDAVRNIIEWFAPAVTGEDSVCETRGTHGEFNVAFVKRPRKRRILNTQHLLRVCQDLLHESGVEGRCHEVDFAELSVKEMVTLMQRTSVLVGVFGAGLVNALFAMRSLQSQSCGAQSITDSGVSDESARNVGMGVIEVMPYRLQECSWSQW